MTALRTTEPRPGARILSVGTYRPTRIVDNHEICTRIDSTDEWIRRRSGIITRHIAGPQETVITMAVEAATKAMAQSGTHPAEIDMVLLATMSFLEQSPPAAPRIAHLLGATNAAALDVSAACAGFCHGLALANSLIRSGESTHVLVIGSEKMSDIIDPTDRGAAFLFGDGAGAVVVGPSPTPGISPVVWGSEGENHHLIAHDHTWLDTQDPQTPHPALRMQGPEVFRWATHTIPRVAQQALAQAGLTANDLKAFIPHQANSRIIDAAAKGLKLPPHTVIAKDITTTGNTSAASIPLAIDQLSAQGKTTTGDAALLIGFGAGLTHAAQVVTLP